MPLTRRSTGRVSASIWPGFVDAMTALLLVMMFLLTIFMVVQFVLREEISGQASRLDALTAEVAGLADLLGAAERRGDALEAEREAQAAEIATLTIERKEQASEIASFEARVASLIAERDEAREAAAAGEARAAELLSEQEAARLALASAREEIDAQAEAARLAAARREALEALTAELRAEVAEREETAAELSSEIETLTTALDEEEQARLADAAAAEALRERLAAADAELSALSLALEEERREAEETLTLLAAAEAAEEELDRRLTIARSERDDLEQRFDAARAAQAEAEAERERNADLLATARETLASRDSKAAENQRRLIALDRQVAQLHQQIRTLQSLLTLAEETSEERNVEIERLGAQLNAALAREAEEQRRRAEAEASERARLERYQSEFFGRLREVLGGREGIQISGDRFVFDSEVLFPSGSAVLSAAGRSQIERVAALLSDISDEIPDSIDWVIRVDGHTDDVPVSGTRYADNWELSQARALSVVRYMSEELGFPARRLAPTGFGEYRPIAPGSTPEARALNRRIELKLTER